MLLHADNELEPRSSRSIARVNIARTRSLSFSLTNADGLGAGVISGVISIIDLLTSADRSIGVAKVRGTRSQLDRSMSGLGRTDAVAPGTFLPYRGRTGTRVSGRCRPILRDAKRQILTLHPMACRTRRS